MHLSKRHLGQLFRLNRPGGQFRFPLQVYRIFFRIPRRKKPCILIQLQVIEKKRRSAQVFSVKIWIAVSWEYINYLVTKNCGAFPSSFSTDLGGTIFMIHSLRSVSSSGLLPRKIHVTVLWSRYRNLEIFPTYSRYHLIRDSPNFADRTCQTSCSSTFFTGVLTISKFSVITSFL